MQSNPKWPNGSKDSKPHDQRTEVRGRTSAVRGRRSEVRAERSERAKASKPLWRIATRVVVCKRGQRTRFKNSNADLQASISFARLLDHFGDRILHQHRHTERASRRSA